MLNQADLEVHERKRLMVLLREAIAATIVLSRPGRSEPRCLKRRKKNFQLMTSPRHEMWVTPTAVKPVLNGLNLVPFKTPITFYTNKSLAEI
jgi:hypothetical protein